MNSTTEKIQEVFRDVFDDEDLTVTAETTADDIEGWDSLMHVTLIVNVEKAFGIRCATSEVAGLKSVGDLITLVDGKVS